MFRVLTAANLPLPTLCVLSPAVPMLGLRGGCCDWAYRDPQLLLTHLSDGQKEHKNLGEGRLDGPVA